MYPQDRKYKAAFPLLNREKRELACFITYTKPHGVFYFLIL